MTPAGVTDCGVTLVNLGDHRLVGGDQFPPALQIIVFGQCGERRLGAGRSISTQMVSGINGSRGTCAINSRQSVRVAVTVAYLSFSGGSSLSCLPRP